MTNSGDLKRTYVSWQNFIMVICLVLSFQAGSFIYLSDRIDRVDQFHTEHRVRLMSRVDEIYKIAANTESDVKALKVLIERDHESVNRIRDILDSIMRQIETGKDRPE